jgi:hypothetical protein
MVGIALIILMQDTLAAVCSMTPITIAMTSLPYGMPMMIGLTMIGIIWMLASLASISLKIVPKMSPPAVAVTTEIFIWKEDKDEDCLPLLWSY